MEIHFATERMFVRGLQKNDLYAFDEMQGNPQVMKYVGGKANTLEENRLDLENVINCYSQKSNQLWVWAIISKNTYELIGTCALVDEDENCSEIGYRFLQKHWGYGYGLEIVKGLVKYAFEKLSKSRLVAYVDVDNKASVRILEQSPFNFQKEFYNEKESCMDRLYVLESN